MNIDMVTDHFSDLLQVATERVACADSVVISSIPPRTDCGERQQRVEALNTVLQDMSTKVRGKFVSNDKLFHLADEQPNDGYLRKNGLHLKEDDNDDWHTVRRND